MCSSDLSNTYFMSIQGEANRHYLQRLAELPDVTGIWPNGNGVMTNFGEGTYVCVHAFAKAANNAGSLDPEKLVDALEMMVLTSPQGEVRMDAATHHASVNTHLSRCERDGRFTIIESFGQIAPVIPERYQHTDAELPPLDMSEFDDANWEALAIMPYPLPDEDELSNPLFNRFLKIKLDSSVSRSLLMLLSDYHEQLDSIVKSGRDQFIEVLSKISDVRKERLLISPIINRNECSYIVISGDKQGDLFVGQTIETHKSDDQAIHNFSDINQSERILGVVDVGIIAIDEIGRASCRERV